MIAQTLEYQQAQEQKRFRTLSLLLQGVYLAIVASGASYAVKNLGEMQQAFHGFVEDLMGPGEPSPEAGLSLAALKFKYGSPRWQDHLDELREEDRDEVST